MQKRLTTGGAGAADMEASGWATVVVGSVLAIAIASYFWPQGGGGGGSAGGGAGGSSAGTAGSIVFIAPGTAVSTNNGVRVGPSSGNDRLGPSSGTAPGTRLGANNGASGAAGS